MKLSALLAPLLDAKADHNLIRAQILAFEAEQSDALEQRRRADAERQSRKRSRDVTLRHSDRPLTGGDARVDDKTLTSEIEPQVKEEKKETRERAFDAFWSIYPHRVGKADALRAFERALKRANLETILAGVRRYAAKTDDRPWCNPATWLNQDRWTDEPAPPVARAGPGPRIDPTYAAALRLQDQFDAVTTSQIEGNHPPPRLVAVGGRSG